MTKRKQRRLKKGEDMILVQAPPKPSENVTLGPLNLRDPTIEVIDLASGIDLTSVPLAKMEAKRRARSILEDGKLTFTRHARTRMGDRRMDSNDVLCVLRGGHINDEGEVENGTVRYRMETSRMVVVFAFRDAVELIVLTAWRKP